MRDKLTIVIAILLTFILLTGLAACNDIVEGGSSEQSTTENINTESQESTPEAVTTDTVTTVMTECSDTVESSNTAESSETDEITTAPPCQHAYDNCDDTVCNECGFEREPISHVFDSCEDVSCNVCNFTRDALEHIYDNCEDVFCNTCNFTREALNHQYDGVCDTHCNLCNTFREAPSHTYSSGETCSDITCSVCTYVKHQDHSYVTTDWQPANLLGDGYKNATCSKCGENKTTVYAQVTAEEVNLPIVYITDYEDTNVKNLQKRDGEITLGIKYVSNTDDIDNFECTAVVKVQGGTSAGFPKKNYNIKLYHDDTLTSKNKVDLGWGAESKYCLKANYVDATQARNIVGARMFGEVVASRENITAGLLNAPNYGAIDGYPVLVYINGKFHGLYTMNIPKDNWMAGMKKESDEKQAILYANSYEPSVQFSGYIDDGFTGWDLEHCSTGDDNAWVKDSFNSLIEIVTCGDDERILRELPNHLDIDAAIDHMIFTYFVNATDNLSKNILWMTYDGEIWIPSMYDMDGTYGIQWDGNLNSNKNSGDYAYPVLSSNGSEHVYGHKLWKLLIRLYPDRVEARYIQLREEILTVENTQAHFEAFMDDIPFVVYNSDYLKWPSYQSFRTDFYGAHDNMIIDTEQQLERLDAFFLYFN